MSVTVFAYWYPDDAKKNQIRRLYEERKEKGLTGVLAAISPNNSSDNSDRVLMSMTLFSGNVWKTTAVKWYLNKVKSLMRTWKALQAFASVISAETPGMFGSWTRKLRKELHVLHTTHMR